MNVAISHPTFAASAPCDWMQERLTEARAIRAMRDLMFEAFQRSRAD